MIYGSVQFLGKGGKATYSNLIRAAVLIASCRLSDEIHLLMTDPSCSVNYFLQA